MPRLRSSRPARVLVTLVLLASSAVGCKSSSDEHAPPSASAECDAYVAALRACLLRSDPSAVAATDKRVADTRDALARADPARDAALCRSGLDRLRASCP